MEEEEKDIEMGNAVMKSSSEDSEKDNEQGGSSYLCCPEDEDEKDDEASVNTFSDTNENKSPQDEDDLGDNEDELHQIKVNFVNEKVDYNQYDKNNNEEDQEMGCFNVNQEFIKIIDQAERTPEDGDESKPVIKPTAPTFGETTSSRLLTFRC